MSVNTGDGVRYAVEVKEEMSENPFPKKRCEDKWPVFIEHFSNQLAHSERPALQTSVHTQFYIPQWEWPPFTHKHAQFRVQCLAQGQLSHAGAEDGTTSPLVIKHCSST